MLFIRRTPAGFTLVEVLVTISIMGVLAALLIPAVLAAREAARRIECTNNLKQIGIGIASYASAAGAFPASLGRYSPLTRLLPFLDQLPIYNAVNYEAPRINTTLFFCSVAAFHCPSDPMTVFNQGGTNYAVNGGIRDLKDAPFSEPDSRLPWVGYQHVTDGLSATAFGTEWLTTRGSDYRDPIRSVFETDSPKISPSDYPIFLTQCRNLSFETAKLGAVWKGNTWAQPGYGQNIYNHALLPFEHTCLNGTLTLQGAWTASSLHGDSVNVVFGDAHVRTVRRSMSIATWLAIGTMNGGEVTDDF